MTTGTMNGNEHAPPGARRGGQRLLNAAREAVNAASDSPQQWGARAYSDAAALSCALTTSEEKLGDALRLIDALLRQEEFLKRKVILLSEKVAQVQQFAYHDELTGLPNRRLLSDRFNQAIARAARQNKPLALLFLDLNGFKTINDTLGHVVGDSLLKQVAVRLSGCIRASDTLCRFGGDEFVILLPELDGEESAAAAVAKIRGHLAAPFFISGTAIEVATSIGISLYPTDGNGYEDLLRQSDVAMYCDKARSPAKCSLGRDAVARRRLIAQEDRPHECGEELAGRSVRQRTERGLGNG